METERLVDILSKSLPKLEVKTLVQTLTDMLKEVGVGSLGFTLTKKQAKALVNTLANSQREVDFETLNLDRDTNGKVSSIGRGDT